MRTFPEGNTIALAEHLDRLINDATLAHQGRTNVIAKYSNTTIVAHFIQAITAMTDV